MSKLRTKYKRLKEENKYLKGFNTPIKIKTTLCDVKPFRAKIRLPYHIDNLPLEKRNDIIKDEMSKTIAQGIRNHLVISKESSDELYTTYTTIINIGFEGGE